MYLIYFQNKSYFSSCPISVSSQWLVWRLNHQPALLCSAIWFVMFCVLRAPRFELLTSYSKSPQRVMQRLFLEESIYFKLWLNKGKSKIDMTLRRKEFEMLVNSTVLNYFVIRVYAVDNTIDNWNYLGKCVVRSFILNIFISRYSCLLCSLETCTEWHAWSWK